MGEGEGEVVEDGGGELDDDGEVGTGEVVTTVPSWIHTPPPWAQQFGFG